ncbi:four helix bundle protein [Myxosarcina sp. GI1(2024)]
MWKPSVELCVICYRLTKHFPQSELYGLTNQIRRAAVSVPSNMVSTLQKLSK